jgi:hypothetical protein
MPKLDFTHDNLRAAYVVVSVVKMPRGLDVDRAGGVMRVQSLAVNVRTLSVKNSSTTMILRASSGTAAVNPTQKVMGYLRIPLRSRDRSRAQQSGRCP